MSSAVAQEALTSPLAFSAPVRGGRTSCQSDFFFSFFSLMLLIVFSSENKTCKSNVRLSRDSAFVSFHSAVIPAAGVRRPRPQEDTNISHALSKRSRYSTRLHSEKQEFYVTVQTFMLLPRLECVTFNTLCQLAVALPARCRKTQSAI